MDLTRIDREAVDEDQTEGQDILRKIRLEPGKIK